LAELDYKSMFEQAPGLFLMLEPHPPRFTIRGASKQHLRSPLTESTAIVGRGLFEAFPDNPADPRLIRRSPARGTCASLERVLVTRAPDTMAVQKYDVIRPGSAGIEKRFQSL